MWADDEYVDPGQITFRGAESDTQNEQIDPFTGHLSLSYIDLELPGNGGLDLTVYRTYKSSRITPVIEYTTALGLGWDIHFGRLKKNGFNTVSIELQDGTQNTATKEDIDGNFVKYYKYYTKDFWKVDFTNTNAPILYLTDGTEIVFARGGTTPYDDWFYATQIKKNNNTINIYYGTSQQVDYVVDSVGRTIDFTYSPITSTRERLTSITLQGQTPLTISYQYPTDGTGYLTTINQVTLPEGDTWQYAYHTSTGSKLLESVSTPFGGTITYDFATFYKSCGVGATKYQVGVQYKTVSGRGLPVGTWTYSYASTAGEDTTVIDDPCGRSTIYRFYGYGSSLASGQCYKYGLTKSKEVYNGAVAETITNYTWDKLDNSLSPITYSVSCACSDPNATYVPYMTYQETVRNGKTFSTSYPVANVDVYGNPEVIIENGEGENSITQRRNDITYWYNTSRNIVKGKAATVSVSGDSYFPGNFSISKQYDTHGNLTVDNTYGIETNYSYFNNGNLQTETDPNNNVTNYVWQNGTVQKITNPIYSITRVVNLDGTVKSETNGRNFTTSYTYFNDMRLKQTTPPAGNPTVVSYGPGNSYKRETRGGFYNQTNYDGLGRESGTADSVGITSTNVYKSCGLKNYDTSNIGDTVYYDNFGRPKQVKHKDNTSIFYSYVNESHLKITDEKNYNTHHYFNSFGDPDEKYLVSVVDATNKTASYTYNILGSLTEASREGITRTFEFGSRNFLYREIHPESGTTKYTRYNGGQLKYKTDNLGEELFYEYDGLNRLKTVIVTSSGTKNSYTYDNADNLKTSATPYGTVAYTYDGSNRMETIRTTTLSRTGTISYKYDGNDNITKITYPSGSYATYQYNGLNQVERIFNFGGQVNNVQYFTSGILLGLLREYTFLNGQKTVLTYNSRRMMTRTDSPSLDIGFQYTDPRGNMTNFTNYLVSGKNKSFSYDYLNRLKTFNGPWGNGTYNYTATGNRYQKIVGGAATTYGYNSYNRLTSESGGRTFGYNGNGDLTNITDSGITYNLEYDPFHNMKKYKKAGVVQATYGYDGNGQRIHKVAGTEKFIYHYGQDGNVLSEISDTGKPLANYVYLNGSLVARFGESDRKSTVASWLLLLLGDKGETP